MKPFVVELIVVVFAVTELFDTYHAYVAEVNATPDIKTDATFVSLLFSRQIFLILLCCICRKFYGWRNSIMTEKTKKEKKVIVIPARENRDSENGREKKKRRVAAYARVKYQ